MKVESLHAITVRSCCVHLIQNVGALEGYYTVQLTCILRTHVKKSKKRNIPLNFVHLIH